LDLGSPASSAVLAAVDASAAEAAVGADAVAEAAVVAAAADADAAGVNQLLEYSVRSPLHESVQGSLFIIGKYNSNWRNGQLLAPRDVSVHPMKSQSDFTGWP
jgi:hypothetical protein